MVIEQPITVLIGMTAIAITAVAAVVVAVVAVLEQQ